MKLLASAPSLEKLREIIAEYYCGASIRLEGMKDGKTWTVHNAKGKIKRVYVRLKAGRYRFERLPDWTE